VNGSSTIKIISANTAQAPRPNRRQQDGKDEQSPRIGLCEWCANPRQYTAALPCDALQTAPETAMFCM
jgi:hypothetical protein